MGLVRRWRGGRSSLGATVNRLGTDVSAGVAAATEEAGRQVGSLAGSAVTVTGSIVVGGASLVADGVVTLATVATGSSRHVVSPPRRPETTPGPGGGPEKRASGGRPTKGAGTTSTRASTGRRSATTKATKASKAPKSP